MDGRKVWLHAVVDNFSRRILSWRVTERFEIANAVAILEEAVGSAVSGEVEALVGDGLLSRVRALADVRFSNSIIES